MTKQEKAKDQRLRKIYKKTLADFNAQVIEQNGGCAICDKQFSLYTAFQDHWHKCCPRKLKEYCGKCCRGLLCFQCNKYVVGVLERMNVSVARVKEYLDKWGPILAERGAGPKPKKRKKK
jgi:Recombination endonuclease VII